jgi:hypothetical protein
MIEFGTNTSTTWLIAAPYSLLLLWCALGAIALARLSKPWATAILMAHMLMFYALWVHGVPDAYIQVVPLTDIPERAGSTSTATVIFSLILLIAAARLSQEKATPSRRQTASASTRNPSASALGVERPGTH